MFKYLEMSKLYQACFNKRFNHSPTVRNSLIGTDLKFDYQTIDATPKSLRIK